VQALQAGALRSLPPEKMRRRRAAGKPSGANHSWIGASGPPTWTTLTY